MFRLGPNDDYLWLGLRVGAGVLLPLAVLTATARLDLAMFAIFGAFTGIYGRNRGHLDRLVAQTRPRHCPGVRGDADSVPRHHACARRRTVDRFAPCWRTEWRRLEDQPLRREQVRTIWLDSLATLVAAGLAGAGRGRVTGPDGIAGGTGQRPHRRLPAGLFPRPARPFLRR